MLEKGLIVKSLLGNISTDTKQTAGREGVPAVFLVHVSLTNLNHLERTLKKFKVSIEF